MLLSFEDLLSLQLRVRARVYVPQPTSFYRETLFWPPIASQIYGKYTGEFRISLKITCDSTDLLR